MHELEKKKTTYLTIVLVLLISRGKISNPWIWKPSHASTHTLHQESHVYVFWGILWVEKNFENLPWIAQSSNAMMQWRDVWRNFAILNTSRMIILPPPSPSRAAHFFTGWKLRFAAKILWLEMAKKQLILLPIEGQKTNCTTGRPFNPWIISLWNPKYMILSYKSRNLSRSLPLYN